MRITGIKRQAKSADRCSIFVDGKFAFSLSQSALLETGLTVGRVLDTAELQRLRRLSTGDKLYSRALRYVAMKPRTAWEVRTYLQRKEAPEPLIKRILNKLTIIDLINDEKFARVFVADRRRLRATSNRKLVAELKRRRVDGDIIERAVKAGGTNADQAALRRVIEQKRRQAKYQDELKLMRYLAGQGFDYGDIKDALKQEDGQP